MERVQKNEENLKIYFLHKRTAFEYIWNQLINEKEESVNNHQKILDFLKKQTGNDDIVEKKVRSSLEISEGSYSMNEEDLEFKYKFEELKKNEDFQKIFSEFLKSNSSGSTSSIEKESNLISFEKMSRTSLDFSIKNDHNLKRLSEGEAFNLESVKQSLDQNISRVSNPSTLTQFNLKEQDQKKIVDFDKFNKEVSISKDGAGPTSEDVLYWENVKTSALETWKREGNIQDIDLLDSMYYQMRLYIMSTLECCEKLKTGNYKNRISLLEQFISFLRLSREYLNEFIAAVKEDKKHTKDILIKGSNDMHKFLLVATTEFLFSTGQTENLEIFKKQVVIY